MSFVLPLLVCFLVHVSAKTCLEDPTQPSCNTYHLDPVTIETNIEMICGLHGMMPEMVGCSVWRICHGNATGSAEKDSVYCQPFSLYKAVCQPMMGMGACGDYRKLCNVTNTAVEDCKISVLPLTDEQTLVKEVKEICSSMFMVACEECESQDGKPRSCDYLQVYSALCLVMPNMPQCGVWKVMCRSIPSWSICNEDTSKFPRMEMFFHTGIYDYILFRGWVPQSTGTYVASVLAVLLASILFEGFRVLKLRMDNKWNREILHHAHKSSHVPLMDSSFARAPFIFHVELSRGILRIFEVFFHYLLMLIAMTFNVGLFLAIVLGSGVGHIIFSPFRPFVPAVSTQEECH
eukprot:TRINITY_DN7952_c0_g1_i1.p1 TRINITY_DN7952_c0_g1~~TRINITY_DN7952_c0_g1_i1.p1  ORF type:complete len:348 (-),score=50.34 TRINITY_DN7952_c0_g1_i1:212-1255(-)